MIAVHITLADSLVMSSLPVLAHTTSRRVRSDMQKTTGRAIQADLIDQIRDHIMPLAEGGVAGE